MEFDFNELFNDSYEFVLNNSDEFFDRFIANFINSSPLVKEAFRHTDMDNQKSMLEKAITHMVIFFYNQARKPIFNRHIKSPHKHS